MPAADAISGQLPYLRRYARALTGEQECGDAFVRATLEALIGDAALRSRVGHSRAALYGVFQGIYNDADKAAHIARPVVLSGHEAAAQARLASITPAHRQALLLSTLEDFSIGEVAEIMAVEEAEAQALVAQAIAEIDAQTRTEVLIIEDEPLIAMQLEQLVEGLGHEVIGIATTHGSALAQAREHHPGLVLADIQLADGSSGIEAVKEILADYSVPVIFITAFPERLLTGERPEPTYLITKPFQEATVCAAIGQALLLGSTARVGRLS